MVNKYQHEQPLAGQQILIPALTGKHPKLNEYYGAATNAILSVGAKLTHRNGNHQFSLLDMHEKIVQPENPDDVPDAYVFLPMAKGGHPEKQAMFRELFKAASLFVGLQTGDEALLLRPEDAKSPPKPIVLVNHKKAWQPFYNMARHLHEQGTISHDPNSYLHLVDNVEDAIAVLKSAFLQKGKPNPVTHPRQFTFTEEELRQREKDTHNKLKPEFNVCVFCSASTKSKELVEMSETLGHDIAQEGWGLITGMGKTGMMGAVVNAAAAVVQEQDRTKSRKRGWVAGSNLMRILEMEGPPDYYDKLWIDDDIYKRMDRMIDNSNAFVIMPGGMGTVQEFMALLLLKHDKHNPEANKKMHGKPIILVNPEFNEGNNKRGSRFWDELIKLANEYGFAGDFTVVDSVHDALGKLEKKAKSDNSDNPEHTKYRTQNDQPKGRGR